LAADTHYSSAADVLFSGNPSVGLSCVSDARELWPALVLGCMDALCVGLVWYSFSFPVQAVHHGTHLFVIASTYWLESREK
jgi:hypothetical protein